MTDSQLQITVAFVTEVISIGIVALATRGILLLNARPLFLMDNPGQPYQWRHIADMNKGRQKQSCALDPVHITCPENILLRMYPEGFSAVIDASKYFHNIMLPNLDEENIFMGLIHPDTGYHY
jgi:hypothetical protein